MLIVTFAGRFGLGSGVLRMAGTKEAAEAAAAAAAEAEADEAASIERDSRAPLPLSTRCRLGVRAPSVSGSSIKLV